MALNSFPKIGEKLYVWSREALVSYIALKQHGGQFWGLSATTHQIHDANRPWGLSNHSVLDGDLLFFVAAKCSVRLLMHHQGADGFDIRRGHLGQSYRVLSDLKVGRSVWSALPLWGGANLYWRNKWKENHFEWGEHFGKCQRGEIIVGFSPI